MTRKLGLLVLVGTIIATAQALGNAGSRSDCPPGCCIVTPEACVATAETCTPCPDAPSCPMPCAPGAENAGDVAVLNVE